MTEKIISPDVYSRESDHSIVRRGIVDVGAAIIGPTVKGSPLVPTIVTSYSEYDNIFGGKFKSGSNYFEYFTSQAVREYFNAGGKSAIITRIISGSSNVTTYASASVPVSGSNALSTASINSSFELESLTWGDIANNVSSSALAYGALSSGSADNIRWEITNADYTRGNFTITIRRGDDNTNQKNVLETFANVSLDPGRTNFISRIIGDQKLVYTIDSDGTSYVATSGSYSNASRYVRVKTVGTYQVNSIDNNGNFLSASYAPSLPVLGSGSLHGAFTGGVAATNLSQKMNDSIGDGSSPSANIQGFQSGDYTNAVNLLINKSAYDFNLVLAPGVTLATAASADIISMCESRGDCMVIIDTQTFGNTVTAAAIAGLASTSNYAATYWPWVQIFSSNLNKVLWVPASVVMGGVYAFNDEVGGEWFAPAGFNRGGIGSVVQAERKLTQDNKDSLYSANINPLATFPGEGVVCWGQKTLQKRATALDRVGVRRLLITLKRYIGQISLNLVFEQNTNATRNRFLTQVNPYLESIIQKQGLYNFRVVMDDSNNTADVIDRNQLVGSIQLQPTRTAEFIILDFNIQPTGATFDTTT